MNQSALRLLRRGAGLADRAEPAERVGSSLDHLIGSWTREEADELDAALKTFETIDADAWKCEGPAVLQRLLPAHARARAGSRLGENG